MKPHRIEWIWPLTLGCAFLSGASFFSPALAGQNAPAAETVRLVPQFSIKDAQSAAFSPDDRTLAVATGNTAQLWDVATGLSLRTLEDPTGEVKSVAFSHNGEFVLTISHPPSTHSGDRAARVWDVKTGRQIHLFPGGGIAAFSPDDRFLVMDAASAYLSSDSAGLSFFAEMREVATGRLVKRFYESTLSSPDTLEISRDNKLLLAGERYEPAKVYSIESGKLLREFRLQPEPQPPDSRPNFTLFSKDGKSVYTGEDTQIRVWDAITGLQKNVLKSEDDAADGALSADGRYLITHESTDISVWDMTELKLVRRVSTHGLPGSSVLFYPQGDVFAAAHRLNLAVTDTLNKSALLIIGVFT